VVAADVLEWEPDAPLDAILIDAPCSATGTIRRHPDLPHLRPNPDLRPLLALQAEMIDRAVSWLKPGGLSRLPIETDMLGLDPEWINKDGDLRLRPDYWAERGGMDGFFVTIVQKT